MTKHGRVVLPLILMAVLVLSSCMSNFPSAVKAPQLSNKEIAGTAVAEAFAAQTAAAVAVAGAEIPAVEELAPPPAAATASPTACAQHVTANTNANVRLGDTINHDIIGNLPTGASANVAGQNADHTWWYIEFPSGPGGHGWIAGSVVTPFCIAADLVVVAAPALPTQEEATPKPTKKAKVGVTFEVLQLDPDVIQHQLDPDILHYITVSP